jgi:HSP20 family molecular chaperone IbpA
MFQRTVRLLSRVESGKAVASLKNGVLSITIPKSHVAENQPKKLKIQTM